MNPTGSSERKDDGTTLARGLDSILPPPDNWLSGKAGSKSNSQAWTDKDKYQKPPWYGPNTKIVVVDGADGLTPDMLRRRAIAPWYDDLFDGIDDALLD
jgi:hypothetical protein